MKKKKMIPKIQEMETFSKEIVSIVERDRISYIEAVTEYCERVGLEIEVAAMLITPTLVTKISEEAMEQNLIQRNPVLPI